MKGNLSEIKKLVDITPNDMLLGEEVRKYINSLIKESINPCVRCKKEIEGNYKSPRFVECLCSSCDNKMIENDMIYNSFMRKYNLEHALCPKCHSQAHTSTIMGYILHMDKMDDYKDLNTCKCIKCGDEHTVHERVSI